MWGMTGRESNPASLFQLYVNCGRYAEATYLLLEYIESFASMVNYLLLWIEFITVVIRIYYCCHSQSLWIKFENCWMKFEKKMSYSITLSFITRVPNVFITALDGSTPVELSTWTVYGLTAVSSWFKQFNHDLEISPV
jgi:hypothetical protein